MLCRIEDLRCKEIVDINNGVCMGCVSDLEIDTAAATIKALVIYGRVRLFGLLGREEDIIIPWKEICCIGEDAILVKLSPSVSGRRRREQGRMGRLHG